MNETNETSDHIGRIGDDEIRTRQARYEESAALEARIRAANSLDPKLFAAVGPALEEALNHRVIRYLRGSR